MKPIKISQHAQFQMTERGVTEAEVIDAILTGETIPAKKNRLGRRKNFQFAQVWGGKTYAIKQVLAIIVDEPDAITVVTVYTFYF